MNPVLMELVIDCLAFLELSGDDVVNPDSAITQIESISSSLHELNPEDMRVFVQFCRRKAEKCRSEGIDLEKAEFFERLPEELGLL
jgi:hypothetical protein